MKKAAILFTLILSLLFSQITACDAVEKKDSFMAFIMSLAVPGLGQYYAGSPGYAKIFIAAELAMWGGYYYNTSMMDMSRQNYLSQAALHAGVNPTGKGTAYLNAVGAYDSSFDYNNRRLQSDSSPVLYTGSREWEWDMPGSRLHFRNLREKELDYENNAKYYVAGIVLNHFLAALHAGKQAQKYNGVVSAVSVNVLEKGLAATYTRSF